MIIKNVKVYTEEKMFADGAVEIGRASCRERV